MDPFYHPSEGPTAADIWAIGCILRQAGLGNAPWPVGCDWLKENGYFELGQLLRRWLEPQVKVTEDDETLLD